MQLTKNYSPTKSDLAFEEFRKNFNVTLSKCIVTDETMTYHISGVDKLFNQELKQIANEVIKRLCLPLTTEVIQDHYWQPKCKLVLTYMDNLQVDVPAKVFSLNNIYSPAKLIL